VKEESYMLFTRLKKEKGKKKKRGELYVDFSEEIICLTFESCG